MKFADMIYERPDIEKVRTYAEDIKKRFQNAETFEQADCAFLEWDKMTAHVDTMMSLAYTRHSIDTSDEFYEKEVEFIDEISPEFTEIQQSFSKLLVESTFRHKLEKNTANSYSKMPKYSLKPFRPKLYPKLRKPTSLKRLIKNSLPRLR